MGTRRAKTGRFWDQNGEIDARRVGMTAQRTSEVGFADSAASDPGVGETQTAGPGPQGSLPLTAEMLLERPSGDIFGMTQNAGMGLDPRELGRPQFRRLSTQGGIRAAAV